MASLITSSLCQEKNESLSALRDDTDNTIKNICITHSGRLLGRIWGAGSRLVSRGGYVLRVVRCTFDDGILACEMFAHVIEVWSFTVRSIAVYVAVWNHLYLASHLVQWDITMPEHWMAPDPVSTTSTWTTWEISTRWLLLTLWQFFACICSFKCIALTLNFCVFTLVNSDVVMYLLSFWF